MSLYPPLMTGADAPPSLHNIDDSKIGLMMDEVIGAYEAHAEMRGSQLVFCDLGVPGGSSEYNIHQLIKEHLMMRGSLKVKSPLSMMQNDRAKSELFARVNAGEVRVLLGTTERMGRGPTSRNACPTFMCWCRHGSPLSSSRYAGGDIALVTYMTE